MNPDRLAPALIATVLIFLACSLPAQVAIGGNVFDGSGGPLLGGTVYHVSGLLTVPAGETLTVQPGAIVKFGSADQVNVLGSLVVAASPGNPATFTDLRDDSAGGDTNGNGPSSGAPGYWRGIVIQGGTASLTGLECRYFGQAGYAGLRLDPTPGTTVTDCVFRDYSAAGLDYDSTGNAVVTGTSFLNGGSSVVGCPLEALASFTNNSASGNSSYDAVRVVGGTVAASVTIPAASVLGGAHVLTGTITIAAGTTLTVEAGVVFKTAGASLNILVDGVLLCNGTASAPIVFTELRDDGVGGDTNKNGAANVPAKAAWRGFFFTAGSDASQLTHTIISHFGYIGTAAVELTDADITLDGCTFSHGSNVGVDLNGGASLPVITDCHFDDVTTPIVAASFPALENFDGNTASNCTASEVILVTQTSFDGTASFGGDNLINGVVQLNGVVTFGSNSNVTIDQGAVIKVGSADGLVVAGLLVCDGSGGEVVFTTIHDDSHGGDSNVNGAATTGAPGYWRGLSFTDTADGSSLDHVRVRFAGYAGNAGVTLTDADISLDNSVIEDCSNDAMTLAGSAAMPTVTNCAFDRCLVAIDDIFIDQVPGFTGNTASGNGLRDVMRILPSSLSSSVGIGVNNLLNDTFELTGNLVIDPNGGELTLGAGVICKAASASVGLQVSGTLVCSGTSADPVVFTHIADDGWGGDTDKNGPSTGSPGSWRGLSLEAGSDASVLDRVVIRHSGYTGLAGLEVSGSSFVMRNGRIEGCSNAAIDFNGIAATPTIRDCHFDGNAYAMRGLRWDNLANLCDNDASGNSIYDAPLIESGAVAADVEVRACAMTAGAFVCAASPLLGTGVRLAFGRGVVVKAASVAIEFVDGNGVIDVAGTGLEPVVFTTIADDEFGGDTNKNGASSGAPNTWRGFSLSSTLAGAIEHALVRYSGYTGRSGLACASSSLRLESVRAEHCGARGISIADASGPMDNLVAYSCGTIGIDLGALTGAQPLRFATVTGCGTGIDAGAAWTGAIRSSISWGNTTNYVGATAANLFDSNGEATLVGVNGNIDADPLFIDAVTGDLHLQPTSPCIDAGDFNLGLTVAADHDESSRVNDHDLDGTVGTDMGAYEFCNWTMSVAGQPKLGTTMSFTMSGTPALVVISLALLDYEYYYAPYGMVLCGSPFTLLLQDIWFVDYGYPIAIPNDPFAVGYEIGVQMGCAVYGNTLVGNIANLYRGVIRD